MNALPSIKARPDITPDRALRLFWLNGRAVPRTSHEICERFSASQSLTTACLQTLVRSGHLECSTASSGDRPSIYDPTEAGAARAKMLAGGR